MPELLSRKAVVQSCVVGLCAGLLSGLFGVGGGFIMVPLYVMWMRISQKQAHALSLIAILPIALAATIAYTQQSAVNWAAMAVLLIGTVFGANYGVRLLHNLELRTIQRLFAAVLILTAIRLLWSAQPHQLLEGLSAQLLLVIIGVGAGVLSGLLGVGGGIVIVPALILTYGLSPDVARGTSLAVIVGTAISGSLAHRRRGTFDQRLGIISGLAGVPAALFSSYASTQISDRVIVALFSGVLFLIAIRIIRNTVQRAESSTNA